MLPLVYIGPSACGRLVAYCREQQISQLFLLADCNTHTALGAEVEAQAIAHGLDVRTCILPDPHVVADARHVQEILIALDDQPRTLVVAGSGTLTDLGRFISHRMGRAFISMPTAPSVDGYASLGAPLVVAGVKKTFPAQAPAAIFADLDVLAAAPRPMIAAGFGDMLGKFTSVADWQLGALLWGEPYDDAIARRTLDAARCCVENAHAIGEGNSGGVEILMRSLIDSGLAMLMWGDSRPASGSEHHLSHFWEMALLARNQPPILHGAKVGVATLAMAQLYARLRALSRADALHAFQGAAPGLMERGRAQIARAYGEAAPEIVAAHRAFLAWDEPEQAEFGRRLFQQWGEIQDVAASVPPPHTLAEALATVGAPRSVSVLGLEAADLADAYAAGHFLRDRFTVRKFFHLLGDDAFTEPAREATGPGVGQTPDSAD